MLFSLPELWRMVKKLWWLKKTEFSSPKVWMVSFSHWMVPLQTQVSVVKQLCTVQCCIVIIYSVNMDTWDQQNWWIDLAFAENVIWMFILIWNNSYFYFISFKSFFLLCIKNNYKMFTWLKANLMKYNIMFKFLKRLCIIFYIYN